MFITFEGGEGSGKSTQIHLLAKKLTEINKPFILTREPGGCALSESIRTLLVKGATDKLSRETELLLMIAARVEHIRQTIKPALQQKKWVLCDRFIDSTLVYQGVARGLDDLWIRQLHQQSCQDLWPDLTFLLDLPVSVGRQRTFLRAQQKSGSAQERFEAESDNFHHQVRQGFLALTKKEPQRFTVIDATQSQEIMAAQIWQVIARADTSL
ncbi:dTMP kinase [Magnetococcales bacterium HHB-1]